VAGKQGKLHDNHKNFGMLAATKAKMINVNKQDDHLSSTGLQGRGPEF
jgi:hypothetical protein